MKKILFLHDGRISALPPFLSLLDYLLASGDFFIEVISAEVDDEIDNIYVPQGVNMKHYFHHDGKKLLSRIKYRLQLELLFAKYVKRDLYDIDYDILWVIHESTALNLGRILHGKDYILSVYELNDRYPKRVKRIGKYMKDAKVNVVCEYNRAKIMRMWFHLPSNPFVLPNKPYIHPRKKYLPCELAEQLRGKKIVLYQGYITKDRNIEGICKALSPLNDYVVALMGEKTSYAECLIKKYPNIILIPYVKAPFHLNITSHASIGIVTYDYFSLNTLFCAPNKIWEYAGFGIPMIGNDIPGLKYTIDKSGAGICVDTDDTNAVCDALLHIEKDYSTYSENATLMFDNCQIGDIINQVIKSYLES